MLPNSVREMQCDRQRVSTSAEFDYWTWNIAFAHLLRTNQTDSSLMYQIFLFVHTTDDQIVCLLSSPLLSNSSGNVRNNPVYILLSCSLVCLYCCVSFFFLALSLHRLSGKPQLRFLRRIIQKHRDYPQLTTNQPYFYPPASWNSPEKHIRFTLGLYFS